MKKGITPAQAINWLFYLLVFSIGLVNLWLVHPVPGSVFLLLSLIYFPPVTDRLRNRFGISIPVAMKIVLGFVIIWFTLGVSDLGDMID